MAYRPGEAGKILSVIASRDEGTFYDSIYGDAGAGFLRAPKVLLMEAVKGQNAVCLAKLGWDVTGFDTSAAGLAEARSAGGLVVVECAYKEAGGASFDYETNELLRIFDEFVIRKYEEVVVEHEWARKPLAGE